MGLRDDQEFIQAVNGTLSDHGTIARVLYDTGDMHYLVAQHFVDSSGMISTPCTGILSIATPLCISTLITETCDALGIDICMLRLVANLLF